MGLTLGSTWVCVLGHPASSEVCAAHLACEFRPPTSLVVPESRKPGPCPARKPRRQRHQEVTGHPATRLKPGVTSSRKPSYTSHRSPAEPLPTSLRHQEKASKGSVPSTSGSGRNWQPHNLPPACAHQMCRLSLAARASEPASRTRPSRDSAAQHPEPSCLGSGGPPGWAGPAPQPVWMGRVLQVGGDLAQPAVPAQGCLALG